MYKSPRGEIQRSHNKLQALYILGETFGARRVPGKALEYYRQVADRFTDAASAIQFYTRKDLKVPEVSVVRPEFKPAVAQGTQPGQDEQRGFHAGAVFSQQGAGLVPEPGCPAKPGSKLTYHT